LLILQSTVQIVKKIVYKSLPDIDYNLEKPYIPDFVMVKFVLEERLAKIPVMEMVVLLLFVYQKKAIGML